MTPAVRSAWDALDDKRRELEQISLRDLFAADPDRFARLSASHGGMLLDFSKTGLDADAVGRLLRLAEATGVAAHRDAMFAGRKINSTEGRAVLHVALRNPSTARVILDGQDVMAGVVEVRRRAGDFAEAVRTGSARGSGGAVFTDVVNIGIGGSSLGPSMATRALSPYHDGPRVHFVSNVDSADLCDTLAGLDPATTLFTISSKTFTTVETMTNAATARTWMAEALGEAAIADHFAAISAAPEKAGAFGIAPSRVFGFWDWVGGRYSVWSSIGLPLMIAIGRAQFDRFLAGGHDMDQHFRSAAPAQNLPMLLGLIGVWHRAVCDYASRVVVPYAQRLAQLPAFLQQLEMESNGKQVDCDGHPVERAVGAVVWGAAGTDAQHSFFQLLHQGQQTVPAELIVAARGHEPHLNNHHRLLVANCLAQSEALALGRTEQEATAAMMAQGKSEQDAKRLAPHKTFPGNRPSVTIVLDQLDPFTLGQLIALYEHRVFVEAAVHGINAFDQWGVELGKELAIALEPVLDGSAPADALNGSTKGLVAALRDGSTSKQKDER
ncbi:MAG: glucose-6-phosphate isomerase [Hyphomicrobiaceae bacterium]